MDSKEDDHDGGEDDSTKVKFLLPKKMKIPMKD